MFPFEEDRRVQYTSEDPEYTNLKLTGKTIIIVRSHGHDWYLAVSTFNLFREWQFIPPMDLP